MYHYSITLIFIASLIYFQSEAEARYLENGLTTGNVTATENGTAKGNDTSTGITSAAENGTTIGNNTDTGMNLATKNDSATGNDTTTGMTTAAGNVTAIGNDTGTRNETTSGMTTTTGYDTAMRIDTPTGTTADTENNTASGSYTNTGMTTATGSGTVTGIDETTRMITAIGNDTAMGNETVSGMAFATENDTATEDDITTMTQSTGKNKSPGNDTATGMTATTGNDTTTGNVINAGRVTASEFTTSDQTMTTSQNLIDTEIDRTTSGTIPTTLNAPNEEGVTTTQDMTTKERLATVTGSGNIATQNMSTARNVTLSAEIQERLKIPFIGGYFTVAMSDKGALLTPRMTFETPDEDLNICNRPDALNLRDDDFQIELTSNDECKLASEDRLDFHCTDISKINRFFSGVGNLPIQCTSHMAEITMKGTCNRNWKLQGTFSSAIRQDTRMINNPPVFNIEPFNQILLGCQSSISITVIDQDDDVIRCKWSGKSCQDECQKNKGFFLNTESCKIEFDEAIIKTGTYDIAIQVEDYLRSTEKALSSTPVALIVKILDSEDNSACDAIPSITDSTKADNEPIKVKAKSPFQEQIFASTNDPNRITEIEMMSPKGMTKSKLKKTNKCTVLYNKPNECWYIDVKWTPNETQRGKHLNCFEAVNNLGRKSRKRCQKFDVEDETEEELSTKGANDDTKERSEDTKINFASLIIALLSFIATCVGICVGVRCCRKCKK